VPPWRTAVLTALALAAFAANSLLCREALLHTSTGAAAFTAIRIASGAAMLALLVARTGGASPAPAGWGPAAALFAYAAAFSLAYRALPVASGALLLFGAVQATMVGHGLWSGERLRPRAQAGFALAVLGLLVLLAPGASAPAPGPAALMLAAGVAWGLYSLNGRRGGDPTRLTAAHFARAVPLALVMCLVPGLGTGVDARGALLAAASGALASGLGYAAWYAALPGLRATTAAVVQLAVPALAAVGAALWLGEGVPPRVLAAAAAILGGIALVVRGRPGASPPRS
jgi:drug/metabolite transporter (DMT)-like permease